MRAKWAVTRSLLGPRRTQASLGQDLRHGRTCSCFLKPSRCALALRSRFPFAVGEVGLDLFGAPRDVVVVVEEVSR